MTHTYKHKEKLLKRVRRIRGQLEGVERRLVSEVPCTEILQLAASVRGAMNGLVSELIEEHLREHVVDPAREKDAKKAQGAQELLDVLRTYMK